MGDLTQPNPGASPLGSMHKRKEGAIKDVKVGKWVAQRYVWSERIHLVFGHWAGGYAVQLPPYASVIAKEDMLVESPP